MNPFQSLSNYENFVYTLPQRYHLIQLSTLVLARRGKMMATLQGELLLNGGFRLVIVERLSTDVQTVEIEEYGYEVWRNGDLLYWYDSQPHPHIPHLQSTHPRHKHIPPDIKHNRIPAPGFSFSKPNLPLLMDEIKNLLEAEIS